MLLPLTYEGQLEQAAMANGMSVAAYAAHILTTHLDQMHGITGVVASTGQPSF
jgi:hypothetical protein